MHFKKTSAQGLVGPRFPDTITHIHLVGKAIHIMLLSNSASSPPPDWRFLSQMTSTLGKITEVQII